MVELLYEKRDTDRTLLRIVDNTDKVVDLNKLELICVRDISIPGIQGEDPRSAIEQRAIRDASGVDAQFVLVGSLESSEGPFRGTTYCSAIVNFYKVR